MKSVFKNMLRLGLVLVLITPAAYGACCTTDTCSSTCDSSYCSTCCDGSGCTSCSDCESCCTDCNFCDYGKTWFSQRDQGANEYLVMQLTAEKRHQFDREEFYGDVDLIIEASNLFQSMLAHLNELNSSNVYVFEQRQIYRFSSLEIAFSLLAKELTETANNNADIKKLAVLAQNFNDVSKAYRKAFELVVSGNQARGGAILTRAKASFLRNWREFEETIFNFCESDKVKNLNQEKKEMILSRLISSFKNDINSFELKKAKEGVREALKLGFDDGGWSAVTLYIFISTFYA